MAKKSANIMVRVEPEVKAKAEVVMNELGVPASVVVNMLYKHIIRTGGIPFSVSLTEDTSCAVESVCAQEPECEEETPQNTNESTIEEIVDIPGLNAPKGAKKIITVI